MKSEQEKRIEKRILVKDQRDDHKQTVISVSWALGQATQKAMATGIWDEDSIRSAAEMYLTLHKELVDELESEKEKSVSDTKIRHIEQQQRAHDEAEHSAGDQ